MQQSSAGQVSTERGDPEASESPGIRADWVPGRFGRTGFLADSCFFYFDTIYYDGLARFLSDSGLFQIRRFSDTFGSQIMVTDVGID